MGDVSIQRASPECTTMQARCESLVVCHRVSFHQMWLLPFLEQPYLVEGLGSLEASPATTCKPCSTLTFLTGSLTLFFLDMI